MRILSIALAFVLAIGLLACNSSEQEKAKERAREDVRKTADEAKKAGREIKEDTKELSRRVDAAVQPDSESASDKISHAETKVKDSASHAGVKLDHAALLVKVKDRIASDAGLSTLTNVDVAVNGSVVTLSGTVANEDQKKAVEMAASQVDGITQVQNRLTVQP
jgi:osmotically-inducible protein OsmY